MFPHPTMISTDTVLAATLPADGGHSGRRVEARADTVLTVVEGVVYVVAGDDEVALTPGDSISIPAGVAHRWWNAGDDEARLVRRTRAAHGTCPEALARAA